MLGWVDSQTSVITSTKVRWQRRKTAFPGLFGLIPKHHLYKSEVAKRENCFLMLVWVDSQTSVITSTKMRWQWGNTAFPGLYGPVPKHQISPQQKWGGKEGTLLSQACMGQFLNTSDHLNKSEVAKKKHRFPMLQQWSPQQKWGGKEGKPLSHASAVITTKMRWQRGKTAFPCFSSDHLNKSEVAKRENRFPMLHQWSPQQKWGG
jgi:hypothetical protein